MKLLIYHSERHNRELKLQIQYSKSNSSKEQQASLNAFAKCCIFSSKYDNAFKMSKLSIKS